MIEALPSDRAINLKIDPYAQLSCKKLFSPSLWRLCHFFSHSYSLSLSLSVFSGVRFFSLLCFSFCADFFLLSLLRLYSRRFHFSSFLVVIGSTNRVVCLENSQMLRNTKRTLEDSSLLFFLLDYDLNKSLLVKFFGAPNHRHVDVEVTFFSFFLYSSILQWEKVMKIQLFLVLCVETRVVIKNCKNLCWNPFFLMFFVRSSS